MTKVGSSQVLAVTNATREILDTSRPEASDTASPELTCVKEVSIIVTSDCHNHATSSTSRPVEQRVSVTSTAGISVPTILSNFGVVSGAFDSPHGDHKHLWSRLE